MSIQEIKDVVAETMNEFRANIRPQMAFKLRCLASLLDPSFDAHLNAEREEKSRALAIAEMSLSATFHEFTQTWDALIAKNRRIKFLEERLMEKVHESFLKIVDEKRNAS